MRVNTVIEAAKGPPLPTRSSQSNTEDKCIHINLMDVFIHPPQVL